MKLKTLPTPSDLPAAVPRITSGTAVKTIPAAAIEASRGPADLTTVVSRIHRNALPEDSSAHTCCSINGAIIAETQYEGTRYVLVRCAPKPGEAFLSLSPRERDIVDLITKGYPNKTIAELLDISAWTVGTHLRRIFAKLGVTSRAAMVARYLHHVGDAPAAAIRPRARVDGR